MVQVEMHQGKEMNGCRAKVSGLNTQALTGSVRVCITITAMPTADFIGMDSRFLSSQFFTHTPLALSSLHTWGRAYQYM